MNTYFGFKQDMTQTWDGAGHRYPVTVVAVPPMIVTQKLNSPAGDPVIQVGLGQRPGPANKPLKQHLNKADLNIHPRFLRQLSLTGSASEVKLGQAIAIDSVLSLGDVVTVSGVSKGRGFAGGVKRWGFSGGPRTHGQSDRERAPGSIGQGTTPGRVHKGKKMAGRFGNQRFSIKNLQVVKLDSKSQTVWLSGPIPGARHSLITIQKTGQKPFTAVNSPSPSPTTSPAPSVGVEPKATPGQTETPVPARAKTDTNSSAQSKPEANE